MKTDIEIKAEVYDAFTSLLDDAHKEQRAGKWDITKSIVTLQVLFETKKKRELALHSKGVIDEAS